MKLDKQDWRKLQIPLIILVSVFLLTVVLFALAQTYTAEQQIALQAQQSKLNAARQRYLSSGAEKATITEYLPQYQLLISKGFIGEERRIEWVEELRTQHKNHKLFNIQYSISQQAEYKPTFAANLGGFGMHRSIMKLDLDMLHEGDLLQLAESLNTKDHAPFLLHDCEVTRLNTGAAISSQLTPNLHAQCELDWFTLHEPVNAQVVATP